MVSRDDRDQLATGILLSPMRVLTSASRRGSEACAQTQPRSLGLPSLAVLSVSFSLGVVVAATGPWLLRPGVFDGPLGSTRRVAEPRRVIGRLLGRGTSSPGSALSRRSDLLC